jgi:hypothetical protein
MIPLHRYLPPPRPHVSETVAQRIHCALSEAQVPLLWTPAEHIPFFLFSKRSEQEAIYRRMEVSGLWRWDAAAHVRANQQRRIGQGYDDATGYWLRIWAAAYGLPFKPAWESWS